jgi:TP901 family phage tail tape measure protein
MAKQQETTWLLKLRELVSAPLRKLNDVAGYSQRKLASVANATGQMAKQGVLAGKEIRKTTGSLEQMQNQLKNLERLQAKAFDPKHIQNYERAIGKVKEKIANWSKLKQGPDAGPKQSWWQKLKGDIGSQFSVQGFNPFEMLTSPKVLAIGGIALASAGLMKGVTLAKDFDYGMAKINATAQLGEKTLGKLEGRLVDIGSNSGGNFDRITNAYEKILSTTGKVNLSLDITETAVKGAKAGFADIDLVAGALAQTLASVGQQNATANEVLDTLLKAKAVGAGEFADFAQYLPSLIASAKNLGMAYKDTAGLFSFMTFKGNSAADSAMLIQNMITSLQKKDIIVGLKSKGIDPFNVNGSRKNITALFLEISDKLKNMTDKQRTKFLLDIGLNDAQARQAWSVLTSDAENFKRVMGEVNNSLGETNKQLAATGNYTTSWGSIGDEWKAIGKNLGDALLPVIDVLTNALSGITREFKTIFSGEILQKSYWRDDDAILKKQKVTHIREIAMERTRDFYKLSPEQNFNREQWTFFKSIFEQNMAANDRLNNKNRIDPNEKDPAKANPITHLNTIDRTSFDDKKKGDRDGNGGLKTLIQNLYITNNVRSDEDPDKLKRKLTDDIVDAGRDGLVTLGI